MKQGRLSGSSKAKSRKKAAPAGRRLWGFFLLLLGGLLLSTSFGQGRVALPPHGTHTPTAAALTSAASPAPPEAQRFIHDNCQFCHNKDTASGGLNFAATPWRPNDQANFDFWVKVYDRVSAGEMPPKGMPRPAPAARKRFLSALEQPLTALQVAQAHRDGRAVERRMNRYEYENTLRDLLGAPWLQIKDKLPEDGLADHLNKVGEKLDVSYVQMSRYITAADYALREAMAPRATRPETAIKRYYARDQGSFVGSAIFSKFNGSPERATFPIVGDAADIEVLNGTRPMTEGAKDPDRRELEGMGVVASAYEPLQPRFDRFRAPVSGHYRLRLCAHSFWAGPENARQWWVPSRTAISAGRTQEPVSLYASFGQQLRKLGTVDVGPEKTTCLLDVDLVKGETILPDAVRFFRSRPPGWHNPLAQKDGQPGVVFQWLDVIGPIYETWPPRGHRLMFGDLPLKGTDDGGVEAVPRDANADVERLVRGFMARALRRPVQNQDVQPFVRLAHTALSRGASFTDAMITAYTGVLCSPEFLTMQAKPGTLDDYALASRLSYFLWNSEPDARLRWLADQKLLHKPAVLLAETDRMLADPRAEQFVDAFLDYWLDLRKTDSTSPDETLYPDYYLDDFLTESSVDETRAFFRELIRENLPARNLVSSDFVMVNQRLARLYGLPGVQGAEIRRVELPANSVRGGLLTQASVLKVTANGTTTSPVLRGVWITERILGHQVPPKPASVPAIEPDTRGATTIREQLAKHRTQATCASCHSKIDPPGFALESFDVFGGWRDHYRAIGAGGIRVAGYGKNGAPFAFHEAQPVDPSGVLADGRSFKDVRGLKDLLLQDDRQVARNLVRQLVIYSTGAPVRFADRHAVEAILNSAK
ncbi:MAG: DUF1592 domain-containing protein, partial [Chloroflexi bacterium]|nr:DUF1592 domain-containing protein [Chloroflexota bacterium]